MHMIKPVLLAGGVGTRLWPLSRKSYPKQFVNLLDNKSLFQKSALRVRKSKMIDFDQPLVMTNNEYRFIATQQLESIAIKPSAVLIEPDFRSTAPAILAASFFSYNEDPEAVLLVVPSDHIINDVKLFHEAVEIAYSETQLGKIVTFGINPSRPETAYGYLEFSETSITQPVAPKRFIEKPEFEKAVEMLETKKYLWNSGMFMFKAKDMIKEFEINFRKMVPHVDASVSKATKDLDFLRLDSDAWSKCSNISIDYAIMEKSKNLVVVPFNDYWSDLGGWDAIWQEMGRDINGVAVSDNAHAFNCENSLLRSESDTQEIVGLGLKDIIAVSTPDAVLVAHKDQAQNVKKVVSSLKEKGIKKAELSSKDYRPWGWFESMCWGDRFQVKRIYVRQGASLSLQSHHHRSEHWIVVEGTAKVTIGEEVKLVAEGRSVYIPLGETHRLENPGKVPMVLIEVQTGSYLGEDDIMRYEDAYSRR